MTTTERSSTGLDANIGWLVMLLLWAALALGMLGVWLFSMFKAFQGDRFKLPYIGEVAEKQVWPSERV